MTKIGWQEKACTRIPEFVGMSVNFTLPIFGIFTIQPQCIHIPSNLNPANKKCWQLPHIIVNGYYLLYWLCTMDSHAKSTHALAWLTWWCICTRDIEIFLCHNFIDSLYHIFCISWRCTTFNLAFNPHWTATSWITIYECKPQHTTQANLSYGNQWKCKWYYGCVVTDVLRGFGTVD